MEKTKVCPKCMKEQKIDAVKCEQCGFEFHVKKQETEVTVSSNTTIIDEINSINQRLKWVDMSE